MHMKTPIISTLFFILICLFVACKKEKTSETDIMPISKFKYNKFNYTFNNQSTNADQYLWAVVDMYNNVLDTSTSKDLYYYLPAKSNGIYTVQLKAKNKKNEAVSEMYLRKIEQNIDTTSGRKPLSYILLNYFNGNLRYLNKSINFTHTEILLDGVVRNANDTAVNYITNKPYTLTAISKNNNETDSFSINFAVVNNELIYNNAINNLNFEYTSQTYFQNDIIEFRNVSSSYFNYKWEVDDVLVGNSIDLSIQMPNWGNRKITLIGENVFSNEFDTISKIINIVPDATIFVTGNYIGNFSTCQGCGTAICGASSSRNVQVQAFDKGTIYTIGLERNDTFYGGSHRYLKYKKTDYTLKRHEYGADSYVYGHLYYYYEADSLYNFYNSPPWQCSGGHAGKAFYRSYDIFYGKKN